MTKCLALIGAGVMVVGLVACGSSSTSEEVMTPGSTSESATRNSTAKSTHSTTGATRAPASSARSTSADALVPGTTFHATGQIPCSMGNGQPTTSCTFGVTREGNGSGVVVVTKPDGRIRSVFFTNGKATTADTSEADPGDFSATRQADLTVVLIGKERYEIPDAVINGG